MMHQFSLKSLDVDALNLRLIFLLFPLVIVLFALSISVSEAKPNNNSDKIDIVTYCAKNPSDQSTKCNKVRRH
ncbi:hypothetical protein [Vibrio breoganii]|uniref:hypothetical protein n=1 Tax=Vibrio breoganii TaxID=553239 RepID=UPI0021C3D49A|nr:hypothetical protein [Vibrio breoganii]